MGLVVRVARPVALAILEISHTVANAKSDRQVNDYAKDSHFHEEDQDRNAHGAKSTLLW